MKNGLSILLLLASINFCAAQKPAAPAKPLSDAEIRQKIVGTWILEEAVHPEGYHKLVMTLSADGTSVSKTTLVLPNQTNEWNYWGKWNIKNGICNTTITKAIARSGKSDSVGAVEHCKILNVDADQLIQEAGKQVMILKRKK